MTDINHWAPIPVDDIQGILGSFDKWCLCGGMSIDLLVGRVTRDHGDTDIGVFRSDLEECLSAIGQERVFLCDPPGQHSQWTGAAVPDRVNDIWIASANLDEWILQILVYSDDADHVYYKRDKSIRWSKKSHTWQVGKFRILNPLITLLYKTNRPSVEGKDAKDVQVLIDELRNQSLQGTS